YCRQCTETDYNNLSNDEIICAVENFLQYSDELKSVVFYGGEPLLNSEGVRFALKYINSKFVNTKFSMITNAMLCDENMAEILAKYNVDIIVSADGLPQMHNTARVTVDNKSSYQDTIDGYWRLKKAGCTVGISCTIGPHNENHIESLIEWLKDLHPNSVGFGLPHGDKDNYAMGLQSFPKVYYDLISSFEALLDEGISFIQIERKLRDIINNNINAFECRACHNRLVVCPGLRFGVCEGAVTNDNMFFNTVSEAKNIAYQYRKTSPLTISSCKGCIAQRICGGGCPYDKLMRYGRVDVPDQYRCGFMKLIVDYSLRFIAKCFNELDAPIVINNSNARDKVLNRLNFSKENYIPLQFNCESRIN
ncbi:MAG: radical SAM protein, partial [Ruminococcus flavefaciens]|nr:radical SAM protein [Ruminococcus flavefaciens]